jgi:hypothetical protein
MRYLDKLISQYDNLSKHNFFQYENMEKMVASVLQQVNVKVSETD